MDIIQAIILGLIQGLTEFLPISSSGDLELAKIVMDIEEDLTFTIIVHAATMMSIFVVFSKEISGIIQGALKFQWNSRRRRRLGHDAGPFYSMLPPHLGTLVRPVRRREKLWVGGTVDEWIRPPATNGIRKGMGF